jgi:hypothetical protein
MKILVMSTGETPESPAGWSKHATRMSNNLVHD